MTRRDRDRERIENPSTWPGPLLRMKHRDRLETNPRRAFGYLLADGSSTRTVHFSDRDGGGSEPYPNVEALLDAGWTVD